jgi:uracil phosphoribosyltransferase (EC 2.4.2.9)
VQKTAAKGNPKRKIIASVIATNYGIDMVHREDNNAEIYAVAVDPRVNEDGYIVPGLGDAGDRAFGGP